MFSLLKFYKVNFSFVKVTLIYKRRLILKKLLLSQTIKLLKEKYNSLWFLTKSSVFYGV